MYENKIAALLHRLSASTRNRLITWQETENPQAFASVFSGYTVTICEDRHSDAQEGDRLLMHSISIRDAEDRIVEEFHDEDLSSLIINAGGILREIYLDARRQVRGIDRALDTILADLPDSRQSAAASPKSAAE